MINDDFDRNYYYIRLPDLSAWVCVYELRSIFKSSKFTKWPGLVCVCVCRGVLCSSTPHQIMFTLSALARSLARERSLTHSFCKHKKVWSVCVCACASLKFETLITTTEESVSFTTIRTLTRAIFQSKSETRTNRNDCCYTSYNGGNLPLYHFTTSEITYHARPRI